MGQELRVFLTSTVQAGDRSASVSGRFTPDTQFTVRSVGPVPDDAVEKRSLFLLLQKWNHNSSVVQCEAYSLYLLSNLSTIDLDPNNATCLNTNE